MELLIIDMNRFLSANLYKEEEVEATLKLNFTEELSHCINCENGIAKKIVEFLANEIIEEHTEKKTS